MWMVLFYVDYIVLPEGSGCGIIKQYLYTVQFSLERS